MATKTTARKKKRSRAETERRLIEVAFDLIRRDGVLAGLNLREVADGAGVNRGNIYHYFGSRRELLRAAISSRFRAVADAVIADRRGRSFVERRLRGFRSTGTIYDSELRALLVIDGDETVDPMPLFEEALSRLRQDVIDGDIDRAHDLEALQVALSALLRGYEIFGKSYAKRIDVAPRELDKRVHKVVRVWLEAMAQPPDAGPSAATGRREGK